MKLLALLLSLFALPTFAQTSFTPLLKGLVWSPSTLGVGNVPIPAGEAQSGSTVGIRADGDTTHSAGHYQWLAVTSGTQASITSSGLNTALGITLPPGNYWAALDQTDLMAGNPSTSAWTPEVPFSIPSAIVRPAPPGNVSIPPPVTTSTIAYGIIDGAKGVDKFVPLIVGSVPLGTPCDPTQPVLSFNVIPVASVTWTSALRPNTTVALCGG